LRARKPLDDLRGPARLQRLLFEERHGVRELRGQITSDLRHGRLGEHQTNKAYLAQDQNRVAGARAGQQSGNQNVSIDTNG
jgi:hypothetical protein